MNKILVIEDSEDSRELLLRALQMEDYVAVGAADGIEALRILQDDMDFALILMDLSMPNMNGAEFLTHVRNHPDLKCLKVVLISGWDNVQDRAKELGADGALRKPIDLEALHKEVRRHL